MGYLKKQRNLARIIADPIALAAGLAAGMWIKSKLQCETPAEHLLLNMGIASLSAALSLSVDKVIKDIYKVKAEYGYTPKGITKYIFNKEGRCIDIKKGKDLQIRCYERDL